MAPPLECWPTSQLSGPSISILRPTPQAARAYLAASKDQDALFRQDQAIALARRGLAIATDPEARVELAFQVGDLELHAGLGREAVEAYRGALADCRSEGDRVRALIGVAAANRLLAKLDDAFAALTEAEARRAPPPPIARLPRFTTCAAICTLSAASSISCRNEHAAALEAAFAARFAGMAGACAQRPCRRPIFGLPHGHGARTVFAMRRAERVRRLDAYPDSKSRYVGWPPQLFHRVRRRAGRTIAEGWRSPAGSAIATGRCLRFYALRWDHENGRGVTKRRRRSYLGRSSRRARSKRAATRRSFLAIAPRLASGKATVARSRARAPGPGGVGRDEPAFRWGRFFTVFLG